MIAVPIFFDKAGPISVTADKQLRDFDWIERKRQKTSELAIWRACCLYSGGKAVNRVVVALARIFVQFFCELRASDGYLLNYKMNYPSLRCICIEIYRPSSEKVSLKFHIHPHLCLGQMLTSRALSSLGHVYLNRISEEEVYSLIKIFKSIRRRCQVLEWIKMELLRVLVMLCYVMLWAQN